MGIAQIILFAALLCGIINMPDHPDALNLDSFLHFPLEIPVLALSLILVSRSWFKPLVAIYAVWFAALLLLKLADMGTQAAFQRPFNPYLDIKMIGDGWNILSRSVGVWWGALSIALGIVLLAGLLKGFNWACRFPVSLNIQPFGRVTSTLVALCAGLILLMQLDPDKLPLNVEARAVPYMLQRLELIGHSVADMRRFERAITEPDPVASRSNLMARVAGKDVFVIFVESYGRSAIEDPRYSPQTDTRFEQMSAAFEATGYQVASHWVTSPTVGGLSWLAHGTLLSGMWIDSQARYDRLLMSDRKSLNKIFKNAGWQTVAAMPAITMDWPESAFFGYEKIFAAKDLGYKGKPFNWITMPDQYTLSAIQKLVRTPQPRRNVMVETALISSHAPWTPVASMIDWEAVGDGRVFDDQASSGQSPVFVWADPERIRDHYIRTISYSLDAVSSYISKFGNDAVFIVIGDHQPAAVVTGPDASRDVPLHIITKDASIIGSLESRGFVQGLKPSNNADLRMDELRDLIIGIFSNSAH